jgi:hypothetical protein
VKPVNRNTARQQFVRANLATLSQLWRGLTAAQQIDWTNYGINHPKANRLGEIKPLKGNTAFNMINARLLLAGSTVISDAPAVAVPSALTTFTVVRASATTATLTYTATPLPAGSKLMVWMTTPAWGTVNPNKNQAFVAGFSPAAQASPYLLAFPSSWSVGQTVVWFAAVMDSKGQLSPDLTARVTA